MRRAMIMLLVLAPLLVGCQSSEDSLRDDLREAVKAVPGLDSFRVGTTAVPKGVAAEVEATLQPEQGRTAADLRQLRKVLLDTDGIAGLTLKLVVRRGDTMHQGQWYDATANQPEFDRQAEVWGDAIDSGRYTEVGVTMQRSAGFRVVAHGRDGDTATGLYRDLVAAVGAVGIRVEDARLEAWPSSRVMVASEGKHGALPDALLGAVDEIAGLEGFTRVVVTRIDRSTPLWMTLHAAKNQTDAQRQRALDILRKAGLLTDDLEVTDGNGKTLWT